jgi:NADH-quinone oxidoreductase subunit E
MLSEVEKSEIDHEVSKFEHAQGACIEALMIVQHHRGYVSDDAIVDIAAHLNMSAAELDSVATFYNLIYRKPVGKNVVRVCDSVSCHILGYEKVCTALKNHLQIELGQTSSDNQITLLPAQCLGTCDHAPALMINDELYRDLTPEGAVDLVQKYQRGEGHGKTAHA